MLQETVFSIQETLKRESAGWDRVPELIAVTKYVPADRILPLAECGVRSIAENRVQSLREKLPFVSGKFHLHLIGTLQTNKVKYIMKDVSLVQSVDRLLLAEEISRRAVELNRRMDVLLEVNIAEDPHKSGVSEAEAIPFLRETAKQEGLRVRGFMTMMPLDADERFLDEHFKKMRKLFEFARDLGVSGAEITELSMGMSRDYVWAARNGATMVRIGTALWQEMPPDASGVLQNKAE